MNDQPYYDIVAEELARGEQDAGVWTRAYAKAGGNQDMARPLYILLRVAALKAGLARGAEGIQAGAQDRLSATP